MRREMYENARRWLETRHGPPGFKNEKAVEEMETIIEFNELIAQCNESAREFADR